MAEVLLRGVTKRFGSTVAVHELDLDIPDREFVVLVGPSGCGKSTTLRMIAGLEDVSSGELFIGGRMVNALAPKDRDIAMVFQNYALYPHMSVYENMAFGLRLRGMPRPEISRRVEEAADILDIKALLKRKPKELSGGQRQRVALGRAIVREPQVFLMDEPLSNLDAKLRTQMRTELARLHQRLQTTVIYVTHDQVEAMTLGQRIVVMKDGVVQQVASPKELYARPANMFVAGFIGSPPMNFIRGQLGTAGGETVFTSEGLLWPLPVTLASAAARHDPVSVVLGVRPEDLAMASDEGPHWTGRAEVVESLGSEQLAYLALGPHAVTARVDPDTAVKAGDTLRIRPRGDKLHLFDGNTGAALIA